jgi:hypothetical protein
VTTAAIEEAIAALVGKAIGVVFSDTRRSCAPWGQFDRCIELQSNRWLVLEVEGSQNHPTTNVLKAWPLLEDQPQLAIFMIHVFLPNARARSTSRGRLALWLGEKMESQLAPRFHYRRRYVDTLANSIEGAEELRHDINVWSANAA